MSRRQRAAARPFGCDSKGPRSPEWFDVGIHTVIVFRVCDSRFPFLWTVRSGARQPPARWHGLIGLHNAARLRRSSRNNA
jgi:hypothetical protein